MAVEAAILTYYNGSTSAVLAQTVNPVATSPAGLATYTASFGTENQLTVNTGTGGTALPASGGWYAAGSSAGLIATAASGYAFNAWSLDSGSGPVLNPASAALLGIGLAALRARRQGRASPTDTRP